MPKGAPNKRYIPEFKKMVVETKENEHLSARTTMQEFRMNDPKSMMFAMYTIFRISMGQSKNVIKTGRFSS